MGAINPARLAACLACLMLMAWPLASEAGAKKSPAGTQAVSLDVVGVDITSPQGNVSSEFIHFQADVSGADTAGDCINRHLAELLQPLPQLPVPCDLVSYVTFSVDGQQVVQDNDAPYSIGGKYNGPNGRHTVTAQAWRNVQSDFGVPVLLGQDAAVFCLRNCSNGS